MGLAAVIRSGLESVPAPGAAISVFDRDGPIQEAASGIANLDTGRPVDLEGSQWDLASLTKVLVTLPEVLALVDSGVLTLDTRFDAAWPVARGAPVGAATIGQLLSHAAGIPTSTRLYRTTSNREQLLTAALALPVEVPGSARYCDMGYVLLGAMVSDQTGHSLAELARRRSGLTFAPSVLRSVATERCAWRGRLIVGEVHDENAWVMGGESGHAGAFGTLATVREAARRWLTDDVVSPAMHRAARTRWSTNADGERFGLGWWLPPTRDLGGTAFGPNSHGMSGFVGNRVWLEPDRGYGVVVLSNRVHPVRTDRWPLRRWWAAFIDAVAAVRQE